MLGLTSNCTMFEDISVAAPTLWNSLPASVKSDGNIVSFRWILAQKKFIIIKYYLLQCPQIDHVANLHMPSKITVDCWLLALL